MNKVEEKVMPVVEYDANDELNAVDLNNFISWHIYDIANHKEY